jgi:DNA-binding NtrC family response regulator
MDGMEVLVKLQEMKPDLPVVMISGHGTIDTAVEAIKKAHSILSASRLTLNRLLITVKNALTVPRLSLRPRR